MRQVKIFYRKDRWMAFELPDRPRAFALPVMNPQVIDEVNFNRHDEHDWPGIATPGYRSGVKHLLISKNLKT